VGSAQSQKDRFEQLCCVKADISSAPLKSKFMGIRKRAYERDYDIILLTGLTELQAQVGWIDSKTVRVPLVLHILVYLIRSPGVSLGEREEVCSNVFQVSPSAEFNFQESCCGCLR